MLPRRIAATLGVAVGFAIAAAAPAAAAVTIGQAPPIEGGLGDCGPAYTVQISNATGPGYVVPPPGGVLTRWRTTATGELSFLLWHEEKSALRLLAKDPRTVTGGGEFAARIPVSGGERLGLGMTKEVLDCEVFTKKGEDTIGVAGETAIGDAPAMLLEGGFRLNVAADIEPDADHDGYGDETQDCLRHRPVPSGSLRRRRPAGDHDHETPEEELLEPPGEVPVQRRRARVDLRMQARQTAVQTLQLPVQTDRRARPAQLQGPLDRCGRQSRPDRREIRLDRHRVAALRSSREFRPASGRMCRSARLPGRSAGGPALRRAGRHRCDLQTERTVLARRRDQRRLGE